MKLLSALALLFIGPIVLAAGINFIGWLGGKFGKNKLNTIPQNSDQFCQGVLI